MNTKIANFSELENMLSVKSDINGGIITLFGRFGLGNQLRHLSLEILLSGKTFASKIN